MTFTPTFLPDLEWSRVVAQSVVDELLIANLIPQNQMNWAIEIVTQDIHIKLVSGLRPKDDELPS